GPAVGGHGIAHHRGVPVAERRVPAAQLLQQLRGALDVGEQERDRPGRQLAHVRCESSVCGRPAPRAYAAATPDPREDDVLLENRNAVVYGVGPVGAAVARTFAREGARLFLAGRTAEPLEPVAAEIVAGGGRAETATVDTLEEEAVDRHADEV